MLGTRKIIEIGEGVSEVLSNQGITEQATLGIELDDEAFSKLDEDLFYRNRKDETEEYVKSDKEIDVEFDLVKITIRKKVEC